MVNNYLPCEIEDNSLPDYKQISTLTTSKSSVTLQTHLDSNQFLNRHNRQTSMDQSIQLNSSSDNSTLFLKKNSSSENDLIGSLTQDHQYYQL